MRSFLKAFRYCLETFIRCCAARPRDANKKIVGDNPIYKEFLSASGCSSLFSRDFFKSKEFETVASHIRKLEDAEMEEGT